MTMNAAGILRIEKELAREIPVGFFKYPEDMENKKDRAAYEAMKAVQNYRRYLLSEEASRQEDPDCGHDVCPICGAHLDHDEKCSCMEDKSVETAQKGAEI